MRTALYRHIDSMGRLLYVGVSLSAANRLAQHRDSPWFDEITQIKIEWFDDRTSALSAEKQAIRNESPVHNITHRVKAETAFIEFLNEIKSNFPTVNCCSYYYFCRTIKDKNLREQFKFLRLKMVFAKSSPEIGFI